MTDDQSQFAYMIDSDCQEKIRALAESRGVRILDIIEEILKAFHAHKGKVPKVKIFGGTRKAMFANVDRVLLERFRRKCFDQKIKYYQGFEFGASLVLGVHVDQDR